MARIFSRDSSPAPALRRLRADVLGTVDLRNRNSVTLLNRHDVALIAVCGITREQV